MRKMRGARALAMALAVAMMVCGIAGSTLAWLVDKTDSVTNTFTYGDINIELEETTGDEYEMVPGRELDKDPKVTVLAGSEASWLFVKVEESANFDDFMTYEIAEGWTALTGVDGVYYREVNEIADDGENAVFSVLKDDKVTVKGEVTKDMMNALDANGATDYPTLTFTAYAVQKENMDNVADAWAATQPAPNPAPGTGGDE